ncbi:VIT1/CCC1 transporter family protein [Candidatus Berkelbacteria bacterium]|nr:VIT1/CCC1 transporter family protein [Candidatus Berkelbacteria bacterium]
MQRRGFIRNFIFGSEDSLVSTVGLLSGISFAGLSNKSIIVSGLILILVEALSMAAGVYLSEETSNEISQQNQKDNQSKDAGVMFISYLTMGLIPLLPYIFIVEPKIAFYFSITFSLLALFLVGIYKGRYVKKNPILSAVKITLVGGGVIILSVLVGYFLGR